MCRANGWATGRRTEISKKSTVYSSAVQLLFAADREKNKQLYSATTQKSKDVIMSMSSFARN